MRSRPASQLADDGEAVGMPPAVDPSSAEPLLHQDGVRKSVGPAPDGSDPNDDACLDQALNLWLLGQLLGLDGLFLSRHARRTGGAE